MKNWGLSPTIQRVVKPQKRPQAPSKSWADVQGRQDYQKQAHWRGQKCQCLHMLWGWGNSWAVKRRAQVSARWSETPTKRKAGLGDWKQEHYILWWINYPNWDRPKDFYNRVLQPRYKPKPSTNQGLGRSQLYRLHKFVHLLMEDGWASLHISCVIPERCPSWHTLFCLGQGSQALQ